MYFMTFFYAVVHGSFSDGHSCKYYFWTVVVLLLWGMLWNSVTYEMLWNMNVIISMFDTVWTVEGSAVCFVFRLLHSCTVQPGDATYEKGNERCVWSVHCSVDWYLAVTSLTALGTKHLLRFYLDLFGHFISFFVCFVFANERSKTCFSKEMYRFILFKKWHWIKL